MIKRRLYNFSRQQTNASKSDQSTEKVYKSFKKALDLEIICYQSMERLIRDDFKRGQANQRSIKLNKREQVLYQLSAYIDEP